jgi:hypothetical protein
MGHQTLHVRLPDSAIDHQTVLTAVEDILQSAPFRATRQCQDLLRYVVNHSLSGEHELLRERLIGIEVFGRKPDYDTGNDPIVRIRAADLRKKLAQYYHNLEEVETPVRIDVPSGSYRASFQWMTFPAHSKAQTEPSGQATLSAGSAHQVLPLVNENPPSLAKLRRPFRRWVLVAASLAVLLGLSSFLFRRMSRAPESEFDQFWSSFVSSPKPLLVCVGSNAVYRLSDDLLTKYRESHHLENLGTESFVDLPAGSQLSARDIVPQPNTFVGVADMAATSQVVALLAQRGKAYQQRLAGDLAYGDLRHTPTILVGGFSNPWTMEMTSDLRFVLVDGERIEDRQDKKRVWSIVRSSDGVATDDYAVISRLQNGKNGDTLLALAGIGSYGTQAAGEFITDPQMIARLASSAPTDWNKKNMQVVLHIHVVHLAPSTVDVAAIYFW